MKRKLLAVTITGLMAFAGTAVVSAADPGNGNNGHGMCTAYFSGSEQGQENKRANGKSFITFESGIGDYDEDGDTDAYDVALWCNDFEGGYGNPGGGNTPFFDDEDTPADDTDYGTGTGTGSNDGNGNGREKTEG